MQEDEERIKITFNTNADDAAKSTDNLATSIDRTIDSSEKLGKNKAKNAKETKNLTNANQGLKKSLGGVKTAFKGVGVALKGLGIGLVISAILLLKEALFSNQKVVDAFNVVLQTANVLFNKLFNVVNDVFKAVSKSTGGFDGLLKVLKGVYTIGVAPLKLAFDGLRLAIATIQLAWEDSFLGGEDQGKIKELKEKIDGITKSLIKTGGETIQAGKDIVNNFSEAITEVGTLATGVIDGVKEISVTASIEQAKNIVQAKKNFELLALQQQRLQLQYQRDAELLRQIRDDDQKSITDRIEANKKLGETLKLQGDAERETIKARIASIQQEQNALGVTAERTNEIFQLKTDLIDLEERLAGQTSEQLTNNNALLREQNDLEQTVLDAKKERAIAQAEFEAKNNPLKQLELQREAFQLQRDLILEDLEAKRELYILGTQSRVDAEQDYLTKKQAIDNAILENEKSIEDARVKNKQENNKALAKSGEDLINATKVIAGKNKSIQKAAIVADGAVSLGKAATNTAEAVTKDLAKGFPLSIPLVAADIAVGAASAVSIISNTKKALQAVGGGGSGLTANPALTAPTGVTAQPQTGFQASSENQIATSISQAQEQQQPIKAFVVTSEITEGQNTEAKIIQENSF